MNKQQAKRFAWRVAFELLDQTVPRALAQGRIESLPEADQERVRGALKDVTQHCYERSCGNIQRVRGY